MKKIPLTKGKFAIVDDDDYEKLNAYNWQAHWDSKGKTYYVHGRVNGRYVVMARIIKNAVEGEYVDHINHDTLDNRKENLRICRHDQNCFNRKGQYNSTSKYKGVSYKSANKNWVVQIRENSVGRHIGSFKNEIVAALVYDEEAERVYGEHAYLNFPLYR